LDGTYATEDYVVVNRCFKCSGYNHRASDCRGVETCPYARADINSKTALRRQTTSAPTTPSSSSTIITHRWVKALLI